MTTGENTNNLDRFRFVRQSLLQKIWKLKDIHPKTPLSDVAAFVRYMSLAIQEREMCEYLAGPEVMSALARDGLVNLGLGVISLLEHQPLQRAVALAVLVSAAGYAAQPSWEEQVITAGLKQFKPTTESEAQTGADRLASIAPVFGCQWETCWDRCLEVLSNFPDAQDTLLVALAEAAWRRFGPGEARPWELLSRVSSLVEASNALKSWVSQMTPDRVLPFLESQFHNRQAMVLPALLTVLDKQAQTNPAFAKATWLRLKSDAAIPKSPETILAAPCLWRSFGDPYLKGVLDDLGDPRTRIISCMISLSPNETISFELLLQIWRCLDVQQAIHWSLYAIDHTNAEHLEWPAKRLQKIQYDFGSALDLAHFLNLIAKHLPKHLDYYAADLILSPIAPVIWRETAASLDLPPIQAVCNQLDKLMAMLNGNKWQAQRDQRDLLVALGVRLVILHANDRYLQMLPTYLESHELDLFHYEVALGLYRRQYPAMAEQLALELKHPTLRIRALLLIAPTQIVEARTADFFGLFSLLSDSDFMSTEFLRLSGLLKLPAQSFQPNVLRRFFSPEQTGLSMIETAMANISYDQQLFTGAEDPDHAVRIYDPAKLQQLPSVELCRLLPEIAGLGSSMADGCWEASEAIVHIFSLNNVPLADRLETYDRLVIDAFRRWRISAGNRRRLWPALFDLDIGDTTVRGVLREYWTLLFPPLLALYSQDKAFDLFNLKPPKWLTPEQRAFFHSVSNSDRVNAALEALRARTIDASDFALIRAISWMWGRHQASRILELIDRLPREAERDGLLIGLAVSGVWPGRVEDLSQRLTAPESHLRMAAHIGYAPRVDRETGLLNREWIKALAKQLESGSPTLQLWVFQGVYAVDQNACPILAAKALSVLQRRGSSGGRDLLRLWLSAYISPRADIPKLEGPSKRRQAQERIEKILENVGPTNVFSLEPDSAPHVSAGRPQNETAHFDRTQQRKASPQKIPNWQLNYKTRELGVVLTTFYGILMPLDWVIWDFFAGLPLSPPRLFVEKPLFIGFLGWALVRGLITNARIHVIVGNLYLVHPALRRLLSILAMVPFLGFFVQVILERLIQAKRKQCPQPLSYGVNRRHFGVISKRLLPTALKRAALNAWALALLIIGDFAFLLTLSPASGAVHLNQFVGFTLLLSTIGIQIFITWLVGCYLYDLCRLGHKSKAETAFWTAFAVIWLLPIPLVPIIAFYAFIFTNLRDVNDNTLTRMLRNDMYYEADKPPQPSTSETLRDFFAFKMIALAFETTALGWVLLYYLERLDPGREPLRLALMELLIYITIFLMLSGLVVISLARLKRLNAISPPTDRTCFGRYLFCSQASVCFGLHAALTFYSGNDTHLLGAAVVTGIGGIIYMSIRMRGFGHNQVKDITWQLGFLILALFGLYFAVNPYLVELNVIMGLTAIMTFVGPVLSVFGNIQRRPSFFRALDAGETWRPPGVFNTPQMVGFLKKAAILPFGGIWTPVFALHACYQDQAQKEESK